MTVNTRKLRAKIYETGLTISELSVEMKMTRKTLANKLKGDGKNLKMGEIHYLVDRLEMDDDEILDTLFVEEVKRIGFIR